MTRAISDNIIWHHGHVDRNLRQELLGQKGFTIWITGLPSSGKSTTAFTIEHELIKRGRLAYVLDGDNIRHGLNKNLGFSAEDREENIRRIGEVAKLFADAGVIIITSFISPFIRDRELAREIHRDAGLSFIEVFINTPMEICADRDPKGLYAKAKRGEIKGFTGVDDPYEPPLNPDITIDASKQNPGECFETIISYLQDKKYIER